MGADPTLEILKLLGAAVLAYLGGRWQKAWEIKTSDMKDRVDELCKLIDKVADDAAA